MTWDPEGKVRTGTAWWKRTRQRILKRDGGRCTWVTDGGRCPNPATDVDHRLSVSDGGTDEDGNLRSLCTSHHRSKTAAEGVAARAKHSRKRKPPPHPGLRA